MFAKVNQNHPHLIINACGMIFRKERWSVVPAHEEKWARKITGLEICEDASTLPADQQKQCEEAQRVYMLEQQQLKTSFFQQNGGIFTPKRPTKNE